MKAAIQKLFRKAKSAFNRFWPLSRSEIAFLHIGKNAGTQIMHLADQLRPTGLKIRKYSHSVKLQSLPNNARYFFSIRDPYARFKSGFYSRKRKGQPRIYSEWSRHEEAAFGAFEHANDLAEALFRDDERGALALQAIQSIEHTAMHQIDWFTKAGFLDTHPPVWIVRSEHFDEDFAEFMRRAGASMSYSDLHMGEGSHTSHRNDYSKTPDLSDLARQNLQRWYQRDFAFYQFCELWMQKHSKDAE